ncbi:PREDICTED: protein crooked neck-like [Prunus mume]|uniref:Protein crooked neck-like n=1 Tax=Prunus mume TaxID=102107 RepID=A0ABM0N817_PRUMU|nr:PREDICTED: protein crooked neck-like [Prunus mume]
MGFSVLLGFLVSNPNPSWKMQVLYIPPLLTLSNVHSATHYITAASLQNICDPNRIVLFSDSLGEKILLLAMSSFNQAEPTQNDLLAKLPPPAMVNNKNPATVEITAEQILREARDLQLLHNEFVEGARAIYEQSVQCQPNQIQAWMREVYERALEKVDLADFNEAAEQLLVAFAEFEEQCKEILRAMCIYKFALDHLPKGRGMDLYSKFVLFRKRHGVRLGIEDALEREMMSLEIKIILAAYRWKKEQVSSHDIGSGLQEERGTSLFSRF